MNPAALSAQHLEPITAYIGVGSNLTDPVHQVTSALNHLEAFPETRLVAHSHLYRSPPFGHLDQPDFINAVAHIETTLDPEALLAELLSLEQAHGRVRLFANGPRTLDLDILMYGTECRQNARLTLPHPRLAQRSFVLLPWLDVAPETLMVPGQGTIAKLLANCPGPLALPL
ncbi:2-amino-4-hydroxy-6-hydroxymethyldihydropteridine diphosphokinase [Ferrovum myxofaciens]|uniref:2-amino-4-hydroxy-6- hydroxymethyldihydropteridine diphosphokinase n=1 Tax=Ferrovum myxofaciens TaxID=416213 RepID=UPI0023532636|nr:2-amino-4-hydroxy-6-hydroxymethyldihydropteridine diphosphokinase [Ferrovum myxofaciens]MBU6993954.1 2-amino-4-hydroxy-6-hydroxymethyldihydropteridine diphosphokinase [Ferrovum myxofaciens]